MADILVPIMVFVTILSLGGAVIALRSARRQPLQVRLDELELSHSNFEREEVEQSKGATRLLEHIGRLVSGGSTSTTLRAELAKAGHHNQNAVMIFLGAKIVLLIMGLILFASLILPYQFSPQNKVLMILGGAAALFFIPNIVVRMQREKRKAEVRIYLAEVIDLLEISVSAGLGLDQSWNSVADEIRTVSATLADEMALTNLETYLGAPRADAMRHMAERTGAEEISSLVSVLVQSDQFGTSISDALRTFATSMREQRSQRAEEMAEKMPVKMIFPLALLIFPAVVIVMCGPAAITWMQIMEHKR